MVAAAVQGRLLRAFFPGEEGRCVVLVLVMGRVPGRGGEADGESCVDPEPQAGGCTCLELGLLLLAGGSSLPSPEVGGPAGGGCVWVADVTALRA